VIDRYHANLVHYNWHWFWKTGNGDLNNQGTHQLDVACWAIDDDQAHPVRALALGGRFAWRDQGETPNTMFAMAEYANGQKVLFNVRNVNYDGYTRQVENEYYLEDGSVIVGDGPFRIRRPGGKEFESLDIPPGRGSESRQRRRARCPPGLRARPPDEQLLPAGRRDAV
jgi:predicted dehydrogenase